MLNCKRFSRHSIMPRNLIIGFLILVFLCGSAFASVLTFGGGGGAGPEYVLGRVAVRFNVTTESGMSSAMKESIVDSIVPGAHVLKEYSLVPGLTLVSIPAGTSVPEAETLFGQSSNILYSERDYKIEIDAMPDDTLFPQLWGMHNIGQTGGTPDADIDAPEAWNYETGSSDVIVAVIDTGVDYDHEDLADNMWVNTGELNGSPGVDDDNNGFIDDIYGYDFANNDGDPMDDNSHGTHCSGTIGGVGNNGIGVAGVCWNVKIMALKFLSASGGGATMDAIGCVDYAVQMGATLTSNSWGGGGYSQALKDAIDASGRAGMLFVAAAGNSSANNDTLPHYPSSYDLENIIAVMSTDQDDAVSGFSCYGLMSVDLAAPGSSILSSVPGNSYDSKSGTSMSTPHVAGACALLKSASPSLGYIGIKDAIFQSVNVLPSLDGLCVTAGRLNVAEAVELVAVDVTPPSPDPMEWRTEPTAVGVKTICMEAVLALDSSGVEYYFECTSTDDPNVNVLPSDYDSVWQSSETYSRDDFVEGTTYTFRVMARDLSENLNETQWSPDVSATTASPTDDLPPFPSPAQWLVRPKAVHYDSKAATNRVSMRAREGFDESLPIQYKFDCVSVTDGAGISQPIDPVLSSAWQSFNVYTINFAWNASFNYAFTVTVRDSAVPSSNETAPSEVATFSVNATGTSVYTVPVPYRTIQSAINATQNNGDTVVVRPGTYSGSGNRDIDFNARTLFPVPQTAIDIIVRSIDPDNPAVVAATIIDCGGLRLVPMLPQDSHRGFIFRNGETSVSELAGFTITGGYICVDGAFPTVFGQAGNPGLPSRGGAISCTTASSPTISKCVITNCVAEGGYGSPGAPGAPQAGSTNGGNAGNGALGAGGAIYCDPTSRPAITDLTIDGCFAEGGYGWWGGRGADADPAGPTAAGVGGNGGNAGAAFGGAIFVDAGNPGVVITNTTIRNCGVVARNGGDGGDGGDDTVNAPPVPGTPGGAGSSSNAVGGGIACGANGTGANVTIINCTIDNNQATSGAAGTPGNTGLPTGPNPTGTTGNNSLGHGGGVWYDANCGAVTINGTDGQRTTISNNTSDHGGGGIRFNSSSANATSPTLTNCDITGNATLFADGGGIRYGTDGTMIIDNCLIDQNTAIGIPNRAGGGIYAGRLGGTPPTVTIRNGTVISGNTASAGGGVYASNTNLNILSSSEFLVNTADVGAGLWIGGSGSNLTITDSELTSNSASQAIYGQGGAMLLSGINGFTMNDSLITGNDSNGYGGGLYLEGFNATAFNITNSLFTENTALYEGGAISCNFGAWTQIYNCTIANNATEEDNIGIGGGIHCSENFAWVEVFDSIIWGNTASQGSQLAAGRYYGSLPGYEWADIDINSSDVQDGLSDVFQELPPEYPFGLSAVWFLGGGNIDADPEFLLGYFLSANDIQGIQSPCVDAGDINTTILINDPNYTTRTDFGVDTAPVDMGYHYDASEDLEQFTLTVEVVNAEGGSLDLDWPGGGVGSEPGGAGTYEINRGYTVNLHAVFADPNSPLYILGRWEGTNDDTIIDVDNFVTMISDRTVRLVYDVSANYAILRTSVNTNNGTIDPSREGVFIEYSPDYLIYERGTVVTLKAYPDNPVSRVRWRGTDYDYHTSNIATVTLDQSRDVDADFYQPNTLIVGPSGEGTHTSIQHAIEEADEDDIIQVLPGTYNIYESPQPDESHSRIFIDGKRLTLRGSPQDPSATVIQGGFLILNVGRDTVIEGFTISGQYGGATYVTPNTAGMDGWPGDPVSGGGMRLFEYAPYRVGNVFITTAHPHDDTTDNGSPTVKNCVFFNCSIRGDNGGHGATGTGDGTLAILGEPGHGGWAGWAHGGAVAIGSGADPIFVDCEFIDNIAIGGDGGNGGNAAPALGGHGGNWGDPLGDSLTFLTWEHGPFEEYWFYSGFGGAVYCGNNSKPEFIDCEFSGNVARGGSCGVSGNNVLWEDVQTFWPFEHYLIDRFGGAVYGARGSMPIFENCEFVGNQADTTGPESHRDGEPTVSDDVNISFGGAVAFEDGSVPEFTDCTFTNNEATLGGAAYTVLAGFNAISTVFENNTALNAGALAVIEGTASIEDSSFAENTATAPGARGGAIFSFDSTVEIFSSELENNTAEGSGGGVYASGNDVVTIKNSLLHDNNAGSDGGAIASELMAETHVSSSTVVGNIAGTTTQMIDENGEVVFVITGTGGGLSSGVNSNVIVTDSIFWDNEAANGPQLSVGLENSTLAVSYSDIEGEMQNVYINDPSSTLLWGLGNINVNPLFATGLFGDHYLSYVDDTPNLQSPCVDTGSDLASNLGYSNYTTSVDHIPDENDVDMGYHQKLSDNFYTLNIQTFAGNSGVLPVLNVTSGVFNEYMTVPLEVLNIDDMPPGYRVQWTGTNKDAEVGSTNTVTMLLYDMVVEVEFVVHIQNNLLVPAQYATVEEAITVANSGDKITLAKDLTHYVSNPDGIDLMGKALTITSDIDPENPNFDIIASTIIDCQGSRYYPGRAFRFHNGEGEDTVILGLTIVNGYTVGDLGIDGGIPGGPVDPGDDNSPVIAAAGTDAEGDGYGGAILCEGDLVGRPSSPTIKYCVFVNNNVTGGQGGDGINGFPIFDEDSDVDGEWGGAAGSGTGNGYGGAIALIDGSSPKIIGCMFTNNSARGGSAGNAGNGSINYGSGRESWGGDGGNSIGDGIGGAIYASSQSSPLIQDCVFEINFASEGNAGLAGVTGAGGDLDPRAQNGVNGTVITFGLVAGGAIYYDIATEVNLNVNINSSSFTGNSAYTTSVELVDVGLEVGATLATITNYTRGGAVYCAEGARGTIAGNGSDEYASEFISNLGGAVYLADYSLVDISDTLFKDNSDAEEGGAIYIGSGEQIDLVRCDFLSNSSIINGGAITLNRNAAITGCTFGGNDTVYNGGAIEAFNESIELSLDINACSFGGNTANFGGAIYIQRFDANFDQCYIIGNTAVDGGGAYFVTGSEDPNNNGVIFTNGIIGDNRATGKFGGAAFMNVSAIIENSIIENNITEASDGYGGGLNFSVGNFLVGHSLKNCLVTGNSSISRGGAIACSLGASPEIMNSTFRENEAMFGGALWCDYSSTPTIIDSIFENNRGHAIGEDIGDDSTNADISYSLFYNNPDGDHGLYDSAIGGNPATSTGKAALEALLTPEDTDIYDNDPNIYIYDDDPVFVDGPLGDSYLYQGRAVAVIVAIEITDTNDCECLAGEVDCYDIDDVDDCKMRVNDPNDVYDPYIYMHDTGVVNIVDQSPAIDTGSGLASGPNMAMDTFTTNPALPGSGIDPNDKGQVDIGYHYKNLEQGAENISAFKKVLTIEIVDSYGNVIDCDSGDCHGTYELSPEPDSSSGDDHTYYISTQVTVELIPATGYRVASWSGAIDDSSLEKNNFVIMDDDRTVKVSFEQPRILVVGGGDGYTTIQHAIDEAVDGDTVVVQTGIYRPATGIELPWRELSSIEIVNKDITLTSSAPDDPFIIANTVLEQFTFKLIGVTSKTVIDGFTISSSWDGAVTRDFSFPSDGADGISVIGGAMIIDGGSPTIRNCNFNECSVTGGDGANGTGNHGYGNDGGWAGRAYGGAVFMTGESNPVFENCLFNDCFARGGNGGNGSSGANTLHGGRGGNWEWAPSIETGPLTFPNWYWWDGWTFGFAQEESIYNYSNRSYGYQSRDISSVFLGGTVEEYLMWLMGQLSPEPGEYDDYWKYSGYGGAVYIEKESSPRFVDCRFIGNQTYGGVCGVGGSTETTPDRNLKIENYGGAVYVVDNCNVVFDNCQFSNNRADNSFNYIARDGAAGTVTQPTDMYISYGGAVCAEENSTLKFTNSCTFTGNESCLGGAVYWAESHVGMSDSIFVGNTAYHGAGMYALNSTGTVEKSTMQGNQAQGDQVVLGEINTSIPVIIDPDNELVVPGISNLTIAGLGGGLYSSSSIVDVNDTVFESNIASASGGGVYYDGSDMVLEKKMKLNNCLLIDNEAGRDGGAISSNWYAEPTISNCTVADNEVTGTFEQNVGMGGGLASSYFSHATIINSIFWDNEALYDGSQLAVGSGAYQPEITVENSDIQFGESKVYLADEWSVLTWVLDPDTGEDTNIDANPMFMTLPLIGEYFLDQSGPCIDAGSTTAIQAGLSEGYTTSIESIKDSGDVDMGYHYLDFTYSEGDEYTLVVDVIDAHGTVEYIAGPYPSGSIVTITAIPENLYRVKSWSGDVVDRTTRGRTNTVIMIGEELEKNVEVTFEPGTIIRVPSDYTDIQTALAIAGEGDVVIVSQGTYFGGNIVVDKDITLTSSNPDDPDVVANTIIDCYGDGSSYINHGVIFTPDAVGAVLNGFTIINGLENWVDAADGTDPGDKGGDGAPSVGGGIICMPGSMPTVKNCVISNCIINGGNAGNGASGDEFANGGNGGWGGWARGGGVFVGTGADAAFINCTISNNQANGGNGGNGGDFASGDTYYSSPGYGGLFSSEIYLGTTYEVLGYPQDFRFYSGYGGGVYCDQYSIATFTNCTITGNSVVGGMSGIGGANIAGIGQQPVFPYEIPSYGGGAYCAAGSTVTFTDCVISDNVSPKFTIPEGEDTPRYHVDPYLGHGGGVALEETASVSFEDCIFNGNEASVGGGIYWLGESSDDLVSSFGIVDCNFVGNFAYQGGGVFAKLGDAIIANTIVLDNFAGTLPGDTSDIGGVGGGMYLESLSSEVSGVLVYDNTATTSGGGLFYTGQSQQQRLFNSLIHGNESGRDGGGISMGWYANPNIVNCTIADNEVVETFGYASGYGGGIYAGYHSNATILHSIIWGNYAGMGKQMAVGTGFEYDPRPATLTVLYCNSLGGQNAIEVYVEDCPEPGPGGECPEVIWENNIITDPMFVRGPLGEFYLSQYPTQTETAAAVDAGSFSAAEAGLNRYTTKTTNAYDKGAVDLGYHYPVSLSRSQDLCKFCDLANTTYPPEAKLRPDGIIGMDELQVFMENWLAGLGDDAEDELCSEANQWCGGADINTDTFVDLADFAVMAICWLVEDIEPPFVEDPTALSAWAEVPEADQSLSTISMTAQKFVDAWFTPVDIDEIVGDEVQYKFACIEKDGFYIDDQNYDISWFETGWLIPDDFDDPDVLEWTTNSLTANIDYTFVIKVKDLKGNIYTSDPASDWLKPNPPSPIAWDMVPTPTSPDAPYDISMSAVVATSAVIGETVKYRFVGEGPDDYTSDSGWQTEADGGLTWIDTAPKVLAETYTYVLEVKDDFNEGRSAPASAIAGSSPPTPDPMTWVQPPSKIYDTISGQYMIVMEATEAVAYDGGDVWYEFTCYEDSDFNSVQLNQPVYFFNIAGGSLNYTFTVRARDVGYNWTAPSTCECTYNNGLGPCLQCP